jgi:hypothetical protein
VVWQTIAPAPPVQQLGVLHSQPRVLGGVVLQLVQLGEHVYAQAVPTQLAPPAATCCDPQATPQAPQFAAVVIAVSHPLPFGAPASQSS